MSAHRLTATVMGRKLLVELHQKDQYGRVVGMAYIRVFPWLRRRNVSAMMLEAGCASLFRLVAADSLGTDFLCTCNSRYRLRVSWRRARWTAGPLSGVGGERQVSASPGCLAVFRYSQLRFAGLNVGACGCRVHGRMRVQRRTSSGSVARRQTNLANEIARRGSPTASSSASC